MSVAHTAPLTPANDDVVLETVAPLEDPAQRELDFLRDRLSEDPANLERAARYVQAAIERGRALGDSRYYRRAESALNPWRTSVRPPVVVRVLRATLLQQRHDFAGALLELDAALTQDPGHAQARLTRATIRQVQGRLVEAGADCAALRDRASVAVARICEASVLGLNGRSKQALEGLSSTPVREAAPVLQVWAWTLRAEIHERRGEWRKAENAFREAMRLAQAGSGTDFYLLAAYADFLIERNKLGEARRLLERAPRTDALLLRRARAMQEQSGPDAAAPLRAELAELFDASAARGETGHEREQAAFELYLQKDPRRALEKARKNWQNQREPPDARLLLEAAVALGARDAAAPVLAWMTETGIEDVRLRALRAKLESRP